MTAHPDQTAWWRSPAVVGWLVLLIVGLVVILEIAEPQPAFVAAREIEVAPHADGWIVTWVLPAGHIIDAGLQIGDRVVAANGRVLTRADDPANWLTTTADLVVTRAGEMLTIPIGIDHALGPTGRIAYTLAGLLFALVGVTTWLRSGGGRVQASFLLLCSTAGLGLAVVPAVWRGHVWATPIIYGCATGAVTALLLFSRRFPYDHHVGRGARAPGT